MFQRLLYITYLFLKFFSITIINILKRNAITIPWILVNVWFVISASRMTMRPLSLNTMMWSRLLPVKRNEEMVRIWEKVSLEIKVLNFPDWSTWKSYNIVPLLITISCVFGAVKLPDIDWYIPFGFWSVKLYKYIFWNQYLILLITKLLILLLLLFIIMLISTYK